MLVRGCSDEVIAKIKELHPDRIKTENPPADQATSHHLYLRQLYGGGAEKEFPSVDQYLYGTDPNEFIIENDKFTRYEYIGKVNNARG